MSSERWLAIEESFHALLDVSPSEREARLLEMAKSDSGLTAAVRRLLAAHELSSELTLGAGGVRVEIEAAPEGTWPSADDRIGERLGPYELVEEIGRGGMATVYRGRRTDEAFERDVAVKILRAPIEDQDLRTRFGAERQILAELEHPSIARLYDGGVTEDRAPYLVLELVNGLPIDDYCNARGSGLEERLRLFRRVCEAVAFAHRRLIVHRDLKPSNILVDEEGEVRLLDFGIAKLIGADARDSTHTAPDFRPLTPRFASPEQLRGEPVTTASDVFSLGVLLYLLATGDCPFSSTWTERLGELIEDRAAPRPSEAAAARGGDYARMSRDLRGDLDAIVEKAIRVEGASRYQTIEELLADLRRAERSEPVLARQGSWAYRSSRWIGRNRAQLAAAALLFALCVAWAWTARRQADEVRRQRDAAELEATKATETSDFLVGLFESAAPSRSGEAHVTARELLNRGAERARRDLADQPNVQGEMLFNIGLALMQLRLPAEALPLFEEALSLRRDSAGDLVVAKTQVQIARANGTLGQYPKAERAAREAIAICRRLPSRDATCLGSALHGLGETLAATGAFDEARIALEEALLIADSAPGPGSRNNARSVVNALGMLAYYRSDWQEAVDRFARAHGDEELDATIDDAPDVARNINAWGAALQRLDRPREALALHEEAYAVLLEVFGPIHENVAGSISKMGTAQLALGELDSAEASLGEALRIQQQLFPLGHPRISFTETNLARVLAAQGRLDEAERLWVRGIVGMRRTVPDLVQRCEPLTAFARFLMEQERHEEAMELLMEAREVAASLPPDSPNFIAITRAIEECERALAG